MKAQAWVFGALLVFILLAHVLELINMVVRHG